MENKKKWITWTTIILLLTNFLTAFTVRRMPFGLSGNAAKYNKLFLVRDRLYKYYDGPINEDKLVEGAIKGMAESLKDPYTVFMNKEEFEKFNTGSTGMYVGIGIQVGVKDDKILVISTFENSPAKKSGILSGDVILKVNDIAVPGKELEKAISMMKGKKGKKVKLTLFRKNKGNFDVDLVAEEIHMQTVRGEMLNNNIGYIQISSFDENTGNNFNTTLKQLKGKGMNGLILDLRGNPGGLLGSCVDVVSNFVPKGAKIVSTVNKYKKEEQYKSKGGMAIKMPLVILTDEGTASASEIVSGAIKDYKLGTLVGQKTFGKGVVQRLMDTGDGTALKVTVSKYYTPAGKNINHIGISPDIEVKYPEELLGKQYDRSKDPQFNKALEVIKEKIK